MLSCNPYKLKQIKHFARKIPKYADDQKESYKFHDAALLVARWELTSIRGFMQRSLIQIEEISAPQVKLLVSPY